MPKVRLMVIDKQNDSVAYPSIIYSWVDDVNIISEKEFEYTKRYSSRRIYKSKISKTIHLCC
ncbi:hypothetical protein fh0823_24700 [Francisella halioticida]|uniref:hypothetical protein n=1 Tax=Francisella halioticida TaxID=549298 RepID=UPI0012F73FD0|nr:hypothetical protein [Francisella halioticida]BCD92331.1 hypothetical protein fh0823_24700 [Francisella halioticida]